MAQADAAQSAAQTQAGASEAGIAEQRRQFDTVQKLLEPYVTGGAEAFKQQQALIGAQGPEAQRAAIAALEQGPAVQALTQQGENALLQRASATGGLRGGNVQAALAQFRPQMLNQLSLPLPRKRRPRPCHLPTSKISSSPGGFAGGDD